MDYENSPDFLRVKAFMESDESNIKGAEIPGMGLFIEDSPAEETARKVADSLCALPCADLFVIRVGESSEKAGAWVVTVSRRSEY